MTPSVEKTHPRYAEGHLGLPLTVSVSVLLSLPESLPAKLPANLCPAKLAPDWKRNAGCNDRSVP